MNIGAEEEKGNALVKETFPLLKACQDINFIGSIEAREIPHGGADVIVCEAFVGNVILKLSEGVGAKMCIRDSSCIGATDGRRPAGFPGGSTSSAQRTSLPQQAV